MKRLYPHFVLDSWKKLVGERRLRDGVFAAGVDQYIQTVFKLLAEATVFDFCAINTEEIALELSDFTVEMSQRGLLRLPFPICAFLYNNDVDREDGASSIVMLSDHPDDPSRFNLTFFAEIRQEDHQLVGAIPILGLADIRLEKHDDGISVRGQKTQLADDRLLVNFVSRTGAKDIGEAVNTFLADETGVTLSLLVMLMSKGVEVRHEPAPDRLNKQRIKQGRTPIADRRVVKINVPNVRYISTESGDMDIHERKSPRMHWRRGHFRTLHTGKVVPVAPALVNAAPDEEAARPLYEAIKRSVPTEEK